MVDRVMVYTGELPETSDILNTNKFAMFGLGYSMRAVLGTNIIVDGLACTPTSPTPDLNVTIGVGSIYAVTQVDASAYSDLGADTSSIVKQGLFPTATQLGPISPPGTAGQSQVFLVQAIYNDVDTGATVEPYYNASNPSSPFSGPANAGTSNFTVRQGKCVVALKAGVAATTGSQVTPAPDAGYTGLFAITVANGATQITSGNIVQLTTAPILQAKLPDIPAGVQKGTWQYALDSSAGGSAVATTATTSTSSAVLTFASVPAYIATGMKVANLTTPASITGGQTVLSKTGTTVTMSANANATVNSGDSIAFSGNALVASIAFPTPAALTTGMEVHIQSSGTISGSSTFNLNGLGAVAIHRANGSNTAAGDITANEIVSFIYDGAAWQIENFTGGAGGGVSGTSGVPYGSDTSTSSNTITVTPSPTISSLAAGQPLLVKLANPITGAVTINVAGQTASTLVSYTGQALAYGAAGAGEILLMNYDGTRWQLLNAPLPLQNNTTIYVNVSTGSDSLDGSQPTVSGTKGPLQHIAFALAKASAYGPSQFTITIQIADGTYNESVVGSLPPSSAIVFNGNAGNPSNVVVNGAINTNAFSVGGPNVWTVQNLKVTTSGSNCAAFAANSGATMKYEQYGQRGDRDVVFPC
jgi:hypothetical protein